MLYVPIDRSFMINIKQQVTDFFFYKKKILFFSRETQIMKITGRSKKPIDYRTNKANQKYIYI